MSKHDEWQRLIETKKIAEYWIERCSRAEKQLEQRNWISVKDKLPDEDTVVLVYTQQASYMNLRIDYIHNGRWSNSMFVTHWMPLPLPPKENVE